MLVDLRASVEAALGRRTEMESGEKAAEATAAAKAAPGQMKSAPLAAAAAAAPGTAASLKPESVSAKESKTKFAVANEDAPEFEVSAAAPEWAPDEDSQPGQKK
jgi:hypothetical protein